MEDEIRRAIEGALSTLGFAPVDFSVEHPMDLAHGEYASNVALVCAGMVGKAPRDIAEQCREALSGVLPAVEKIDIAGQGFLNFHLRRDFFKEKIATALAQADNWGKNTTLAGKKVMIEYTDPNPFKELHIGHLVPNALGESLARLFMFAGAETKRVTYQGDVGMQIAKAIYGMQQLHVTLEAQLTASDLGKAYAIGCSAFEDSPEAMTEITNLNKAIYERTDSNVNALYDKGKAVSLTSFEEGYTILGSEFDHNFFESETGPVGAALVRAHPEIFETSDGAVIFRGEQYGLHTRVFINAKGLPTYEAKDLGLMELKDRWWPSDHSIYVTGSEQKQYFAVMTKAAELINPALAGKVELIPNGMLRLPTGKMSSRSGNVIPALELIKEVQEHILERMKESDLEDKETVARDVAVGAIKYSILRSSAGKDIVFDITQSISLEGASGPYLQYTHARTRSILEKAKKENLSASCERTPPEAYMIERILYQFTEVTTRAVVEREPHYVTTYLTELAGMFNSWYAQEKIVDANDQYSSYKIALTEAVAHTLKNGLWCLGIKAPERM